MSATEDLVRFGAVTFPSLFRMLRTDRLTLCPPLTPPGNRYLQMSGMLVGGMIEGDNRMRDYEAHVRMQRRMQRDRAAWAAFDKEYPKVDEDE